MPTSNNCYNFVFYFLDMVAAFVGGDYESFLVFAQVIPLFSQALTYGIPCFQDIDFSLSFDFDTSLMGSFFNFSEYDFEILWTEGIFFSELLLQIAVLAGSFKDHYGMWRWIA
eukprot:CAMPEP_0205806278 /NCGR_PEP_ID=MMETSP0205-20121125/9780_1 /ASSEMBLY_ACC=CAM_ASM_000278 /TAXON_ID=36767 /ORGANISM="Euplotes focardii, Strain TN1" /LENGTH=112 /DNA_ID=CAMNT_0053078893 /DNA_START=54 /DNA_END=388 /DNA_ORIENTATION=+